MLSREEGLCGVGGALVDPSPCTQVAPGGDPQKGPASCGFSHRQDPIGSWRSHSWGSLQPQEGGG